MKTEADLIDEARKRFKPECPDCDRVDVSGRVDRRFMLGIIWSCGCGCEWRGGSLPDDFIRRELKTNAAA